MNIENDNKSEYDDRDLEIGRPHGPREDEEERDGLRVSKSSVSNGDDEEQELEDSDLIVDDDEDSADDGDLDYEPDDM